MGFDDLIAAGTTALVKGHYKNKVIENLQSDLATKTAHVNKDIITICTHMEKWRTPEQDAEDIANNDKVNYEVLITITRQGGGLSCMDIVKKELESIDEVYNYWKNYAHGEGAAYLNAGGAVIDEVTELGKLYNSLRDFGVALQNDNREVVNDFYIKAKAAKELSGQGSAYGTEDAKPAAKKKKFKVGVFLVLLIVFFPAAIIYAITARK